MCCYGYPLCVSRYENTAEIFAATVLLPLHLKEHNLHLKEPRVEYKGVNCSYFKIFCGQNQN